MPIKALGNQHQSLGRMMTWHNLCRFFGNAQRPWWQGWRWRVGEDLQFHPEIYSEDRIIEEYKGLHRIEECSFWGWWTPRFLTKYLKVKAGSLCLGVYLTGQNKWERRGCSCLWPGKLAGLCCTWEAGTVETRVGPEPTWGWEEYRCPGRQITWSCSDCLDAPIETQWGHRHAPLHPTPDVWTCVTPAWASLKYLGWGEDFLRDGKILL